jgi:hypothetical protein
VGLKLSGVRYAHAFAQDWQERLDAFRKTSRAAPQMTYDESLRGLCSYC